MIDMKDIRSVTDFQRNVKECVGRLKRKKQPMVLTVNGRAEVVVQDAQSYQDMLDRLAELEAVAAIRVGLEDVRQGRARPARKAMAELGTKLGISR
jgi:PHD/YefM family antitoxin component YafN of YafNO toxin-antitoxin module